MKRLHMRHKGLLAVIWLALFAGLPGCRDHQRVEPQGAPKPRLDVLRPWREQWEAQQRRDSSERMLNQALREIRKDPNASDAHIQAARALQELGKTQAAIEHVAKALELADKDAVAWKSIGLYYLTYGDYGQAVTSLRKAQGLDSNMAHIDSLLLTALYQAGDQASAIEEAKRALQANPDNYNVRVLYAQWLIERGDPDEAEDVLLGARGQWRERFRSTWQPLNQLRTVMPQGGQDDRSRQALQLLKTARSLLDEELSSYGAYCRLLVAANILQSSISGAMRWLETAQQADYQPNDQVRLADLLAAEGSIAEAKRAYISTGPEVAKYVRRRLERLDEVGAERFSAEMRQFVLAHREQYQSGAELPVWTSSAAPQ